MGDALRIRSALIALVAMSALVACDETLLEGPPLERGEPRVVAVGGSQVMTQLGSGAITPIRVRVVDEAGRPIRSAVVRYLVLAGSGVFSADSTITDDQGFTEVAFRPLASGTTIVEARTVRPNGVGRVQITVIVLNDPDEAATLHAVSGGGQTATAGTEVAEPLVVRVESPDGLSVAGHPVTFEIAQFQGTGAGVSAVRGGPVAGQVLVLTDGAGMARAFLKLGSGSGSHSVRATTLVGPSGAQNVATALFTATATAPAAARLVIVSGQNQTAVIDTLNTPGTPEFKGRDPNPFVVQALDAFGNPVVGTTVTWFVSDGGGSLTASTTSTDANGLAQNRLRGVTEGRNAVAAIASGTSGVEFVVTGEIYVPPAEDGDGGG